MTSHMDSGRRLDWTRARTHWGRLRRILSPPKTSAQGSFSCRISHMYTLYVPRIHSNAALH